MRPIPISVAEKIVRDYGYDQIVIIGRVVGEGEHVTTFRSDIANCNVAAQIGDFFKYKIMGWDDERTG